MKKITLFLMSLFLTVGAMAQVPEPVLELTAEQIGTTYPYQLSDEDANKVFDLTDLTVAVRINTASINTSNRFSLFATSDPTKVANTDAEGTDSRHVGYGIYGKNLSYLASWRGGDRFSGKDNGLASNTKGYILVYVISPGNKVELYTNGIKDQNAWSGTGFMDGYEFATPAMVKADHENAKIYIGGGVHSGGNGEVFNGTITGVKVFRDALSAEQIAAITFPAEEEEPAEVVVKNVEELSNNKVYNLITERGWLIYNEANPEVVASTASYGTFTTGKDVEACQWAIYKSEKNKYYLYNIAADKFVGSNSDEAGRFPFVAEVTNDIQVVKNTTGTEYALVFSTDNYGAINHFNHTAAPGVANWKGDNSQGGLRSLNDGGSAHKVVEVADIATATLEKIAAAVAVFEADNTTAVAKLDVALANAQTLFGKVTIGTGMGEYTATDADYEAKFTSIVAFRQAIQSTSTPTPAEVEAKIGEIDDLIASFKLNLPEAGKYYRIMAVDEWNNDARYLGAQNKEGTSRAEFVASADDNTIFYFDGQYLKSKATGYYLVNNGGFLGYNGEQTEGTVIAFSAASNNLIGAYNISFNGGTRWLYCNPDNNYTDAGGSTNNANGYCFNIEEVVVEPDPENPDPENPTAVENVEVENENVEIYDLTGRKVENITKAGIYIVNGNKVLVK